MKDNNTKQAFIELRAKGWSYDRIAQKLNVSKPTLMAWSKVLALEINNYKAIEMSSLYEQFYVSKKARIEAFGGQVKMMMEELARRDLKDVPTDKLYVLLLKFLETLGKEEGELKFEENGMQELEMTSSWQA
jgi:transcriptional regulator with XRE-family HTH domain